MQTTPKSLRLHIGIFGRTNVGKSTLINALTNQYTAITSPEAGTTTDPVEKSMEMLPIGPVTIIDTAGLDDNSDVGQKRVEKTLQIISRCDVAVIVCDYRGWGVFETDLFERLKSAGIPVVAVINKLDIKSISQKNFNKIKEYCPEPILTSLENSSAVSSGFVTPVLKEQIVKNLPEDFINNQTIVGDLVSAGDTVVLVTPIDKEAPKGRLILPQVQVLRDILDNDAKVVVVKENQLQSALANLNTPPKLVITDSQAFEEVSKIVPYEIPLTSFSILFARLKGDLNSFLNGVHVLNLIPSGTKILVAESCTHHPIEDDIARVKIPKWLKEKTGKDFIFEYVSGHDFPKDLTQYKLVIHCGGCMTNKREILSRVYRANAQNVAITNYGVVIAYCKGILEKCTEVFKKNL